MRADSEIRVKVDRAGKWKQENDSETETVKTTWTEEIEDIEEEGVERGRITDWVWSLDLDMWLIILEGPVSDGGIQLSLARFNNNKLLLSSFFCRF